MGEVVEMAEWVNRRVDAVARNHPPISEDEIRAIWAEHLANNPPETQRASREAWEAGAMREMGFVFPDDPTWKDLT